MLKRLVLFAVAAMAVMSCGSSKVVSTATYQRMGVNPYVTPVQADVQVSPVKISYNMVVSDEVSMGGYDNVVATAVKEALAANGGGDVLVGLQTQAKYSASGFLKSITVTGFPGKYVNFRSNAELPVVPDNEPCPSVVFPGKKR